MKVIDLLDIEIYGKVSYYQGISFILGLLYSIGINDRGLIKISESFQNYYKYLKIRVLLTLILLILISIISSLLLKGEDLFIALFFFTIPALLVYESLSVKNVIQENNNINTRIELLSMIGLNMYRVFLIYTQSKYLPYILFSFALEPLILLTIHLASNHKDFIRALFKTSIEISWLKNELRNLLSLTIYGGLNVLYMRVDTIMLKNLLGFEATGIYNIGSRIVESTYLIGIALVTMLYPRIARNSKKEISYFQLLILSGLLVFLGSYLFGEPLLKLLFDEKYSESVKILKLLSITIPFVFIGMGGSQLMIRHNLENYFIIRAGLGLSITLLLNFLLIPYYGIVGAAIGTLSTQIFVTFLFDFLFPKTRKYGELKFLALTSINKQTYYEIKTF